MERLAALEAEVKADAEAQRARKEAAMVKVRDERAKQQAERDALRERQAQLVAKKPREDAAPVRRRRDEEIDHAEGIGGALELAGKANRMRGELARKPGKGDKSWIKSGIASTALGPIGWLYAGSLREAVPAATAWVGLMYVLTKFLPALLLYPALMVALPLSGLAGVLYALSYNRHGGRQRLFGDQDKKQLPSGER